VLFEDSLLFDTQLTTDGVVMKCRRSTGGDDVEAGEIAARGAAIPSSSHRFTLLTRHAREADN
jgi:hypothetical protein